MSKDDRMDSIYYEEASSSRISSIYYENPDSETAKEEEDMYDYTSNQQDVYDYTSPVIPVPYEVPGSLNDREPMASEINCQHPPSYPPPTLLSSDNEQCSTNDQGRKIYTTLTHTYMPSIYSTPSHSITDFKTNTTASESVLDIVNLESAPSTPVKTDKSKASHSLSRSSSPRLRVKVAFFVFLLAVVVIGMVSVAVGVVSVVTSNDSGSISDGNGNSDTLMGMELEGMIGELQQEIQTLQTTVDQVMNQRNISMNVSSLYESCETETQRRRCNPESGLGVEFSCMTDSLPYEKAVSRRHSFTVYSIIT